MPSYRYDGYLPLTGPKMLMRTVNKLARRIWQNEVKFDSIAISGWSGALFGIPLAIKLNKRIIIVRKDGSFHGNRVEGKNTKRFIIVDDLIDTGETVRRIYKGVKCVWPSSKCIGIFLAHKPLTVGKYIVMEKFSKFMSEQHEKVKIYT